MIGKHRFVWAGGLKLLYAWRPIYGHRQKYLPLVKRTVIQVQIISFGTPTWITVDPNDVVLG
jgi:hypothetical protein